MLACSFIARCHKPSYLKGCPLTVRTCALPWTTDSTVTLTTRPYGVLGAAVLFHHIGVQFQPPRPIFCLEIIHESFFFFDFLILPYFSVNRHHYMLSICKADQMVFLYVLCYSYVLSWCHIYSDHVYRYSA